MTVLEFVQSMRRRWYLLLALLLLTAVGVALVPRDEGVYWSRVSVAFLPPPSAKKIGNALEGSDPSLIYFAAAVQRSLSGDAGAARVSSDEATLYGQGVRRGSSIALVDSGGQWRTNFNRPVVTVEVVDTTEAGARAELDRLVTAVEDRAETMQQEAGSPSNAMIRTELYPENPVVSYVGGNWKRSVLGVILLGSGLSVALTFWFDRLMLRRRSNH